MYKYWLNNYFAPFLSFFRAARRRNITACPIKNDLVTVFLVKLFNKTIGIVIQLCNFSTSTRIVNACLAGNPNDKKSEWTLVDTGLENSADFILQAVEAESKMIGLLNERLTEIGEKIRYKQKLEKDLLPNQRVAALQNE